MSTLPTWVSQSSTDRGVVAPITARARDALQAVLRARRRGQRSDLRGAGEPLAAGDRRLEIELRPNGWR
ncbi:hypothetical protein LAM23_16355 [Mycobacterium tuberculosis]|nr:hypothetical protein [Mycobacterium tuberculosis]MBZ4327744.1 hypothetical protein [Mycobacterium tuberculosis]